MYSRRKANAQSASILVLLLVALFALAVPSLLQRASLFIPVLIAVAVVAILIAAAFLWRMELKRRAKLRALELSDIDRMTGVEFERYVGTILQTQGYKISYTATSGDYGVDLIAEKDHIKTAIQAKRYTGTVGNHAIMEAIAGMQYYHCNKAAVVTTNYFTPHARIQAASSNVALFDREKLAEWIIVFQKQQNNQPAISLEFPPDTRANFMIEHQPLAATSSVES